MTTRLARLILGSITHDTWNTAIEAHVADRRISALKLYGGISSPTGVRTDTHDTIPHGIVHGDHVNSPRIYIGSFADWRDGLEAYGTANAAIHPPLKWAAGAPMGWNSWASYAEKINDHRYLASAAFVLTRSSRKDSATTKSYTDAACRVRRFLHTCRRT